MKNVLLFNLRRVQPVWLRPDVPLVGSSRRFAMPAWQGRVVAWEATSLAWSDMQRLVAEQLQHVVLETALIVRRKHQQGHALLVPAHPYQRRHVLVNAERLMR